MPRYYVEKKTTSLLNCECAEKVISSFDIVNRKAVGSDMDTMGSQSEVTPLVLI